MAKTGNEENLGTAEGAVLGRALHTRLSKPPVLHDTWAIHLLSPEGREQVLSAESERGAQTGGFDSLPILAAGVGCLRYAEDEVERCALRGIRQYGILGAGFDTFALRRGDLGMQVFEIDHPDVQALKRERVAQADAKPTSLPEYVPIDFETTRLSEALAKSSYDSSAPAVFSWMNTLPYLTVEATRATLEELGRVTAAGSRLVVNYSARVALSQEQKDYFAQLKAVMESSGEPYSSNWAPEDFEACLAESGFRVVEHATEDDLTRRYFQGRSDGLKPGLPVRAVTAERTS
jgi:methyltransferase (TIGR00027 family)